MTGPEQQQRQIRPQWLHIPTVNTTNAGEGGLVKPGGSKANLCSSFLAMSMSRKCDLRKLPLVCPHLVRVQRGHRGWDHLNRWSGPSQLLHHIVPCVQTGECTCIVRDYILKKPILFFTTKWQVEGDSVWTSRSSLLCLGFCCKSPKRHSAKMVRQQQELFTSSLFSSHSFFSSFYFCASVGNELEDKEAMCCYMACVTVWFGWDFRCTTFQAWLHR